MDVKDFNDKIFDIMLNQNKPSIQPLTKESIYKKLLVIYKHVSP